MKPKLSYFLSHPIQYISPLLQELAKVVELEVYYYSDVSIKGGIDKGFGKSIQWDIPLLEGYKSIFLKNYSTSKSMNCRFGDALNFGVWNVLRKSKSKTVLVNSWTYGSDLMIIFTAWLFGKKVWLRAENPLNQELLKKGWKQKLKHFILKYLIFKFFINKFLYIGSENKKFYIYSGVSESDLIYTPYSVDNQKFLNEFNNLKPQIQKLKEEFNIPFTNKVILYSGKFIEKKRPFDLLKAFELLKNNKVTLIFLGDGPLRNEMEHYIHSNGINNVILTGFINQSEISKYYSIADVFVMCSGVGETWGLSINEAMNFELPIVVSRTTGSSIDLVKQGLNGFVFNEGDFQSLSYFLNEMLFENFDLKNAGQISSTIIREYSIELIIKNLTAALEKH